MSAPRPALRSGLEVMPQVPPEQREIHDTSQPAPAPSSGAPMMMIRLRMEPLPGAEPGTG